MEKEINTSAEVKYLEKVNVWKSHKTFFWKNVNKWLVFKKLLSGYKVQIALECF